MACACRHPQSFPRNRWSAGLVIGVAMCSIMATRAYAQCEGFAKLGWYNTVEVSTSRERIWGLVQWLRSDAAATYANASSTSASANLPLGEILIGLGFGNSEEGFRSFHSASFSDLRQRFDSREAVRHLETKVSPEVTSLIQSCLSQPGVHAFVEAHPGADEYSIAVKYNGVPNLAAAHITLQPSPRVSCNGPLEFDLRVAEQRRVLCRVTDPGPPAPVIVNANTILVSGGALWLVPLLADLPAPLAMPSALERCRNNDASGCRDHAEQLWASCQGGSREDMRCQRRSMCYRNRVMALLQLEEARARFGANSPQTADASDTVSRWSVERCEAS